MPYEWGGGDAITPPPYMPYHVHFCLYCFLYLFGNRLLGREKQARRYQHYLDGDGDAGAVLSENLRL